LSLDRLAGLLCQRNSGRCACEDTVRDPAVHAAIPLRLETTHFSNLLIEFCYKLQKL
jgi:hypothetical protein